jgi:hypothetical protein
MATVGLLLRAIHSRSKRKWGGVGHGISGAARSNIVQVRIGIVLHLSCLPPLNLGTRSSAAATWRLLPPRTNAGGRRTVRRRCRSRHRFGWL